MVEQQHYITSSLSHQGDLTGPHGISESDRPPATLSTTTTYADITSFSAVPSYSIQHQCDSNLLTPISTIGSPPLNEIRKSVRQHYPAPPVTPYNQVPTPPGSSKMYHQWSNHQFEMNSQASQSSSPMNNAPPGAPDFPYDERRTPVPPEAPYLGSYGVSEAHEPHALHHPQAPYYIEVQQPVEPHANPLYRDHHILGPDRSAPHHHPHVHHGHPPHPALPSQSQNPTMYPPHRPLEREIAGIVPRSPVSQSGEIRIPRRPVTRGGIRKASKTPSKGRGPRSNSQLDPADDHKNCYGQEIPPTLKSTCPEEERCIFESRWRHRHKRGQDMWDSIQGDFYKKFGKQHGKEMLQMKFKRGRAKYLQWPDRDDQLVREAFRKLEKNRYQLILNYFLEMGGSRNMLLSASDIEIKVVNDLKLEDNIYVEAGDGLDVRRRRKVPMKKRPGAGTGSRGGDGAGADVHDMLNVMSHSSLTEDDVINQVYERRDRWDDGPSSPPPAGINGNGVNGGTGGGEMLDVQLWESRAPMKSEPTHLMKYGAHMVGAHHQGPPSQLYQRRK